MQSLKMVWHWPKGKRIYEPFWQTSRNFERKKGVVVVVTVVIIVMINLLPTRYKTQIHRILAKISKTQRRKNLSLCGRLLNVEVQNKGLVFLIGDDACDRGLVQKARCWLLAKMSLEQFSCCCWLIASCALCCVLCACVCTVQCACACVCTVLCAWSNPRPATAAAEDWLPLVHSLKQVWN